MLYPASELSSCPEGQEVGQDSCLAAANALTSGWNTISNRDSLLVNDWGGLPCGCFIYNNQVSASYFPLYETKDQVVRYDLLYVFQSPTKPTLRDLTGYR